MSWFKRKDQPLIPPVREDPDTRGYGKPSPFQSNASTYNASRDDPYGAPTRPSYMSRSSSSTAAEKGYNDPPQDAFSKYQQGLAANRYDQRESDDPNRNELFAGYDREKSGGSNRFDDGPTGRRTPPPGEEEEEDIEGIKQQSRFVKQESVNSTRNALRLAREAEETAMNTVGRLGDQSEKLAGTERHLDKSKGYSDRARDNAEDIHKLNRSIFIPAFGTNNKSKRAAQEAKRMQRYEEEQLGRENAMMEIRDTQNRLGRAGTYGRGEDDQEGIGGRRVKTAEEVEIRKAERKRYQFEATASDDELEDELDDNLDEISDVTKRLKKLGTAMGEELDAQNQRIARITDKTVRLGNKVDSNTERLKRL